MSLGEICPLYLSLLLEKTKLRRKPKSVWVVDGIDDIFWQNLLNQKSPDWCWKKNFRLSRESFFSLHEQLSPYIVTDTRTPNYRCLSSARKNKLLHCITLKIQGSYG